MKNDWFNVLNGFINVPFDENLAYEFEIFFKDFIFLKKKDNNIILRCLKNDKDYALEKCNNSIVLKYNYKIGDIKYFINEKLYIYNRTYNRLISDDTLINSNGDVYKSNINLKKEYDNRNLSEIINRRVVYYGNIDTKYVRYVDVFRDTGNYNPDFKCSVSYDKTSIKNDIKTKYVVPDIIVGTTCIRDKYNTIISSNKVMQRFNCHDDFKFTDNSCPVSMLADNDALDYFMNENKQIQAQDYMKVKKRKIGF